MVEVTPRDTLVTHVTLMILLADLHDVAAPFRSLGLAHARSAFGPLDGPMSMLHSSDRVTRLFFECMLDR